MIGVKVSIMCFTSSTLHWVNSDREQIQGLKNKLLADELLVLLLKSIIF